MMNAELVAADDQRIIIPIVYRNNYLAALKAKVVAAQRDGQIEEARSLGIELAHAENAKPDLR